MASSRNFLLALKATLTVAFIFLSLAFPPLKSVSGGSSTSTTSESFMEKKKVLGSKPPCCLNKCLNCRPCKATLVIPSHQKKKGLISSTSHGDDGSYYLLSWKCRCGDKLFQP